MSLAKNKETATALAQPVSESTLWIVAIILMKERRGGNMALAQSVSWRMGVTEDEARGQALKVAMEASPGFAVHLITTCREDRLMPRSLP